MVPLSCPLTSSTSGLSTWGFPLAKNEFFYIKFVLRWTITFHNKRGFFNSTLYKRWRMKSTWSSDILSTMRFMDDVHYSYERSTSSSEYLYIDPKRSTYNQIYQLFHLSYFNPYCKEISFWKTLQHTYSLMPIGYYLTYQIGTT